MKFKDSMDEKGRTYSCSKTGKTLSIIEKPVRWAGLRIHTILESGSSNIQFTYVSVLFVPLQKFVPYKKFFYKEEHLTDDKMPLVLFLLFL
jgi:hypothetical protein